MASDQLFRLIKSLSSTEKAYIKRYALIHSEKGHESQYIKLFEAIDSMKVYDEKILLRKFSKNPLNFISVSKNYLFNFILRNLESHSKSVKSEIRSCLNQAEILFEKGLLDPCRKKILKAEALAHKYEMKEEMYALWTWKISQPWTSLKSEDTKSFLTMFEDIKKTQDALREAVEDEYELKLIQDTCRNLGMARTAKDILLLENKVAELEKKKKKEYPSFSAAFIHYQKLATLYEALHKPMKALVFSKKKMELLNSNLHMTEVLPYSTLFVTELEKIFNLEFSLGFYDQLLDSFETLNELSAKHPGSRKLMQASLLSLKFNACMRTGKFESALKHAQKIKSHYEEMDFSENVEMRRNKLILECAVANLALKNYQAALKCVDELQMGSASDLSSDLYYFSQILQVLVYFEKGDIELLLYRTRAAYRTLYRHNKLHRIEKFLLDFLKKENSDGWDKKAETQVFTVLKANLEQLFKTYPEEKKLLQYFDLMAWVESKVAKCNMADIIEARHAKLFASSGGKQLLKAITSSEPGH
jgi:hypothetical protein